MTKVQARALLFFSALSFELASPSTASVQDLGPKVPMKSQIFVTGSLHQFHSPQIGQNYDNHKIPSYTKGSL